MRIVVNGLDIGQTNPYIITKFKSSVIGAMKLNTYEIPQTSAVKFVSNYGKGITMEFEMSILASTHEQLLTYIRTLENALYPNANIALDIVMYTDNNDIYRMQGYLATDIEYTRQVTYAELSFTILVPNGKILNNTLNSVTLSQTGAPTGAVLPWTLPVLLGAPTGGAVINNAGNAYASLNITISGPGTNFTIYNNATNEKIEINNLTLNNLQTIEIDGTAQTVKQSGVSIYQFVSFDSTFLTLAPGNNTLSFYVGTGATSDTKAVITWYNTYAGI